jgi:organic radical activating enzyme
VIETKVNDLNVCVQIGCSVNCKYCPQDVITERYFGQRVMSFEDFKMLIATVPKETAIIFCGLSEPFLNPDCTRMILHAHGKGHPVQIYSTLTGLTLEDAITISDIPLQRFVLHLPDSQQNAKIPITPEYKKVLPYILTHVSNIQFVSMNGLFESNHYEDMARGKVERKYNGRIYCNLLENPVYCLEPNGEVDMCCMARIFTGNIGSLRKETFEQIVNRHEKVARRMETSPDSACHYCAWAQPYWKGKLKKTGAKVIEWVKA